MVVGASPRTSGALVGGLALRTSVHASRAPPTAAPSAAGRPPSGSAAAASARRGARSPRPARPAPCAPTAGAGHPPAVPIGAGVGRRGRVPRHAACPSSTGCSAAGWCRAPRSCWPASPASARARCCSRSPRRPRAPRRRTLYVTGEESAAQVRLRADRTGGVHDELYLAAETDLGAVLTHIEQVRPTLLVVDSVQTIGAAGVEGVPGGVTQVKEVAAALVRVAKTRDITTVLVGHVTKDGVDRRAARAGAPRRRRAALRGRPQLPVPDGARDEEPVRPGRRGRLLRPRPPTASPRSPTRPACSSSTTTAGSPAPASR